MITFGTGYAVSEFNLYEKHYYFYYNMKAPVSYPKETIQVLFE